MRIRWMESNLHPIRSARSPNPMAMPLPCPFLPNSHGWSVPFFRSYSCPPLPVNFANLACVYYVFCTIIFTIFLPSACASPNTFSFLSANLNGFGDVYKLNLATIVILCHYPVSSVLSDSNYASPFVHTLVVLSH